MTTTGALLTVGGVFLAYEAFRFISVKELSFSLASLDASQAGLTTNVSLGVKVDNPTKWTNTIDGLQGDIMANGTYLGHASVIGPVPIPAYSSSVIPLGLQLSDLSLASIILGIFSGKMSQAVINFRGKVAADSLPFTIPVDLTYQIL